MFASLSSQPSDFFGSSDDHLEVFSLPWVSDVDDSVCFEVIESVVDGSKISAVVVESSIWLDSDQGNGILLDEDTLGFTSFSVG